ncbi:MAG: hypothetical protein RLZZ502_161 [Pseudomonadota bacterium]|jgi:receptor protein-tyrosine kinase
MNAFLSKILGRYQSKSRDLEPEPISITPKAQKRLHEHRDAEVKQGHEQGRGSAHKTLPESTNYTASMGRVEPLAGSEALSNTSDRNHSNINTKVTEANKLGPFTKLDIDRLRRLGFITPEGERSLVAEELRMIKRPLLINAFSPDVAVERGNFLMVTSSLPGEGKSFTSTNLALSMVTELDQEVILVDADVARPSVPSVLGIPPGSGLMELLLDPNLKPESMLRPTNIPGFSLLLAGRPHLRSTELLASSAMDELLDKLLELYPKHMFVFDSPPLLVTTESRVLAAKMGQIAMVVEAEKTPQEAVRDALSTIESCDVIGLILNKNRTAYGSDYYGYAYGYGYGYGYGVQR